jgi:ribosome-binding protein aMBF1 (putative translation factor)
MGYSANFETKIEKACFNVCDYCISYGRKAAGKGIILKTNSDLAPLSLCYK